MPYRTVEEERWRRAIEQGVFGVWDLDPRLELVHYSPQWKSRLGFPSVQAADPTGFWRCRVHPEDAAPMLHALRSHVEGHASSYAVRFRLRSNGSGYRQVLSRGRVVARDAQGRATRMVGTMVDLTDRPAVAAAHGLPADDPWRDEPPTRLPFHAALGVGHGLVADDSLSAQAAAGAAAAPRLVDLVDDLLALALREGRGALPHAALP